MNETLKMLMPLITFILGIEAILKKLDAQLQIINIESGNIKN